jgi:hypothetical protein
MKNIFNTPFEVSLRVLLTLEAAPRQWLSADWIAASDFFTVYGGDFGITDNNLHGDNHYKYSEFALRREIVRESLKDLVSRRLADVRSTSDGFVYALAKLGGEYIAEIESGYAHNYRIVAEAVRNYMSGKSEREVLNLINRHSVTSLRRTATENEWI